MSGHGHVTPNANGLKARCGGPALCSECASELAALKATESLREDELLKAAQKYMNEKVIAQANRPAIFRAYLAGRKDERAAKAESAPTTTDGVEKSEYQLRYLVSKLPWCDDGELSPSVTIHQVQNVINAAMALARDVKRSRESAPVASTDGDENKKPPQFAAETAQVTVSGRNGILQEACHGPQSDGNQESAPVASMGGEKKEATKIIRDLITEISTGMTDDVFDFGWATRKLRRLDELVNRESAPVTATDGDWKNQFKNFHRMVCEAVGYHHDEIDWKRDQCSLINAIEERLGKAQSLPSSSATTIGKKEIQDAAVTHYERVWKTHVRKGTGKYITTQDFKAGVKWALARVKRDAEPVTLLDGHESKESAE